MTLFLVLGACGGYYCAGLHPVAVCTSVERAQEIADGAHDDYEGLRVVPVPADEVIAGDAPGLDGCPG